MPNVLFLAYFFPPMGGGAVLRAVKFVKYLPAFGWRPLVVAGAGPYHVRDGTLLSEVPHEAAVRWAWRGTVSTSPFRASPSSSFPARLARRIGKPLKKFISFPDVYLPFAAAGRAAGRALIAEYGAEVIYSTAPPFTAHVVAAQLAAEFGLPLVLDYRDAWADNPFDPPPTRWHKERARRAEEGVLARAAAVTAVTRGIADALRARGAKGEVVFLPNGFDEEDFAEPVTVNADAFTVAYAGQLYRGRMPWAFLAAARAFLHERPHVAPSFRFRILGPVGRRVIARVRAEGVPAEAPGVVSHRAAVAAMRAADVNLLLIGDEAGAETTLTGKIFEYLRAGRPILALVPPAGEAAALIKKFNAGVVVAPDDVEGTVNALRALYDKRGQVYPPAAGLEEFDRRNLTAHLARVLYRVAGR